MLGGDYYPVLEFSCIRRREMVNIIENVFSPDVVEMHEASDWMEVARITIGKIMDKLSSGNYGYEVECVKSDLGLRTGSGLVIKAH